MKELFSEYIDKYTKDEMEELNISEKEQKIKENDCLKLKEEVVENKKVLTKEDNTNVENKYFKVFPPLGSKEAYEIQNIEEKDIDIKRPTGKTGVAFGLVQCRKGGRIKVVSKNNDENEEIKFKYYIGHDEFGEFYVDISRDVKYQEWQYFIDASEDEFEFYYTNLPEATTNKLSVENLKRKNIILPIVDEEANVYMREVSPSCIEYVVSKEEEIKEEKYMSDIVKIELS